MLAGLLSVGRGEAGLLLLTVLGPTVLSMAVCVSLTARVVLVVPVPCTKLTFLRDRLVRLLSVLEVRELSAQKRLTERC